MLKKLSLVVLLSASTAIADQGEIYMANQAGGWLTLTHQECKSEQHKKTFPWHAYGTESNGTIHQACYNVPTTPTAKEQEEVPQGMIIIPVINLLDLEDGIVHTLRADLFTSEKSNQLEFY